MTCRSKAVPLAALFRQPQLSAAAPSADRRSVPFNFLHWLGNWLLLFILSIPWVAAQATVTTCAATSTAIRNAIIIAASNGDADVIKIVQGTYTGNFVYTSAEAFDLTLQGGYAAGCTSRVLNPTNTILDGNQVSAVFSATIASGKIANVTIEGLTLRNGKRTSGNGGGLSIVLGDATANAVLNNNIVTGNTATSSAVYGGGIYVSGSANLTNNIISNNTVTSSTSYSHGGGAYISGNATLIDNIIKDNVSQSSNTWDAYAYAGGIRIEGNAILNHNTISNNTAIPYSSFDEGCYGGGVYLAGVTNTISNNTFVNNKLAVGDSRHGGAIYMSNNSTSSVAVFTNNVFSGNTANRYGGGAVLDSYGTISFINNSVNANSATYGGGIALNLGADETTQNIIANNIFWGNTASDAAGGADLRLNNDRDNDFIPTPLLFRGNNLNQADLAGFYSSIPIVIDESNLDHIDPLFVDAANNDLHLQSSSPMINAGDKTIAGLPTTDIDGEQRIMGVSIDIGADEFASTHLPSATTTAATAIAVTGATLNGTVNDNGAATTVNFDFGTTVSYGTTVAATPASIAAGTGNKVVTAVKTGLTCNAVYHYRVKAVNSVGTTNGADQSFTTAACPLDLPVAVTNAATAVAATSATLNGSVTSKGATATASFELGKATSPPSPLPLTMEGEKASSYSPLLLRRGVGGEVKSFTYTETVTATPAQIYSSTAVAVTASKTGLTCNTAYNFRTKAVSSAGTGLGANQTFTTLTCSATSYTVTASTNPLAGGSFISDPDTATVTAGSTKSFIVTANAGYIANQAVTGTCPQGTWGGISNNVWTTGLINANCTVIFGFTAINSWLNPPNQLVIPEQQFTLAIIVKSTSVKVGQYSFTLTFDPTKLGLDLTYPDANCTVGVCPGTNALTTISPPQVNSNTITLKGVDLQGIGPGNDLQLLVIHFKSLFINEEPSFVTGVSLKTNYLDTVSGSSIGLGARAANVIVRSGICGDADGNATVNIVDALAIARQLVGMPPPPTVEDVLADVNEDGRVGITDALHIARYSIGLVTPPEVCAIGQAF